MKRQNQRMIEQLISASTERLRKFITKRKANFELYVEFENQFIKRTRTGAVSCYPYAQTFARIGKLTYFKVEILYLYHFHQKTYTGFTNTSI